MKVYEAIARTLDALRRVEANTERYGHDVAATHRERLDTLCKNYLPSGSGFDNGTSLSDESKPERLVFSTGFHHMTEGMYDGWTNHSVVVTPSLMFGLNLRVTGRNRNEIKEYIAEVFGYDLEQEIKEGE